MANRYIEVTRRGLGSRMLSSIQGVVIGLILFLISFIILWQNEGRVDLSRIASQSLPVSASTVDASAQGKLVAITGQLDSSTPLADPDYLQAGNYIQLSRQVEMFAWVEKRSSKTTRNTGGSETTKTEYNYTQAWTSNPEESSRFKVPEGHTNPPMAVSEQSFTVPEASIGAYTFNPQGMSLPGESKLPLTEEMIQPGKGRLEGSYLFIGSGSLQNPQLGDVRIHYQALPAGLEVTAFGKLDGARLVPYFDQGETELYVARPGTREQAIAALKSEHRVMGWILRLVGFVMMWLALGLIAGPLPTFIDIIPLFGSLSRGLIGALTFVIALVLSLVTITISAIVHNPVALAILLFLLGVGGFLAYRRVTAAKQAVAVG